MREYTVEASDDVVRVTFRGDLDMSRYDEVGKALQQALEMGSRPVLVVFDETVQYVDSFTLSELLLFRKRLGSRFRRVALCVASANIYRILSITDVAKRLSASTNEGQALEALRN